MPMKKLVIVSNESVVSGWVRCGIAEVVDSLANSLTSEYDVSVVCPGGKSAFTAVLSKNVKVENEMTTLTVAKVKYYMVDYEAWPNKAIDCINSLNPDILHNFAEPDLVEKLSITPSKVIYTFDDAEQLIDHEDTLDKYHGITAPSQAYANALKRQRSALSRKLNSSDFRGITNGIADTVFSPKRGLFIPAKFNADDQAGKAQCKQRLKEVYGIKGDPCIYLFMGRLIEQKNIETIMAAIPTIRETGGFLLVVGKGDQKYEQQLKAYKRSDGVLYVDRWASSFQAPSLLSGADFLLQPSNYESCGLMPMTSSCYGAVPIVTLNGGLADNFNENNAIIVDDETSLDDAIRKAAKMYTSKNALKAKRKICMEKDFSWRTRKQGYIELYEKETD